MDKYFQINKATQRTENNWTNVRNKFPPQIPIDNFSSDSDDPFVFREETDTNEIHSKVKTVKLGDKGVKIFFSNQINPSSSNGYSCRDVLAELVNDFKSELEKVGYNLPLVKELLRSDKKYKVNFKIELAIEQLSKEIQKTDISEVDSIQTDHLTEKIKQDFKNEVIDVDMDEYNSNEIVANYESDKRSTKDQNKLPGNVLRKKKGGTSRRRTKPLFMESKEIETSHNPSIDGTTSMDTQYSQETEQFIPKPDPSFKEKKSSFVPPRHVPTLAEQLGYHPVEASSKGSAGSCLKRFHESQKEETTTKPSTTSSSRKLVKEYEEEEFLSWKEKAKRLRALRAARARKKQETESSEEEEVAPPEQTSLFVSARDKIKDGKQKHSSEANSNGSSQRARGVMSSKFVPPISRNGTQDEQTGSNPGDKQDEYLKSLDPRLVELIMSEIIDHGPPVEWDDIAGLDFAKSTIKEIVVWPMLRPDIFTGLRGPPKGILLFGPPGTGKTLIGKCIASQAGATFFSISASSLTSKWVGEGEKMVRALFTIAKRHQPAVIFIDEIDSLLTQRSDSEHESSRRIKTEFLVQLDGATTLCEDRILVVGATNRPQEIDEAARRRLSKRLYIPLPDAVARKAITARLMAQQAHLLTDSDLEAIVSGSAGYSGADMTCLCREAALGPIRSLDVSDIFQVSEEQVRPILIQDFTSALSLVKPSVSESDLEVYVKWNEKFGSTSLPPTAD